MAELTVVTPQDYEALAAYLTTLPIEPPELWRRRFRHWWDDNPWFTPDVPRGWLLRDEARIVGFLGNVATRFRIGEREVPAFSATTWRVDKEARSASLRLYLAQLELGDAAVLFNTTANGTVEKALGYFGFTSRPASASGRVYLLPTRPRRAIAAYLAGRPLAAVAAAVAAPLVTLLQLPARLALRGDGDVRVVTAVDQRFDALWQRTRGRVANTSERSAARIEWFCAGRDYFPKRLLGAFDGEALRGYAILGETSWRGARVLECLDLWYEDERTATALLAGARRHAAGSGFDLLVLRDFTPSLTRLFRRLGMRLTRPEARKFHLRVGPSLGVTLADADTLVTCLDGDYAV